MGMTNRHYRRQSSETCVLQSDGVLVATGGGKQTEKEGPEL